MFKKILSLFKGAPFDPPAYSSSSETLAKENEAILKAQHGDAFSKAMLGHMYERGIDVQRDPEKAFHWTLQAAEKGDVHSQHMVALRYGLGYGVGQNYKEALRWFTLAADKGLAASQHMLGVMYSEGQGVSQDYNKAFQWFCLAAEKECADSQYMIGLMYLGGLGAKQDNVATEDPVTDADLNHACQEAKAAGVEVQGIRDIVASYREDPSQPMAVRDIPQEKRAEFISRVEKLKTEVKKQTYGAGIGQKEALHWFRLAVKQDHADAQHMLGLMYSKGQGVDKDYNEAFRWNMLAAEKGHPYAQFYLGTFFEKGNGVRQDLKQALDWYHLAADQGVPEAQYNLGLMHLRDQGVEQDSIEAHKWLSLAAKSGNKHPKKALREIAQLMTREEIAEAANLAQEWLTAHQNPKKLPY